MSSVTAFKSCSLPERKSFVQKLWQKKSATNTEYRLQGPTENRRGEWAPWLNIITIIIIIIIIIIITIIIIIIIITIIKLGNSWKIIFSAIVGVGWLLPASVTSYPTCSCGIIFNPFCPDMNMHILLTFPYTFVMELVTGICLNIKTSYPWWSPSLFSSSLECLNKRNFIFVTVRA